MGIFKRLECPGGIECSSGFELRMTGKSGSCSQHRSACWRVFIVTWVANLMLPVGSSQNQTDIAPPDIVAVMAPISTIDLRSKGCSRVSCGEPWAGPTPKCSDTKCKATASFFVKVQDTSGSGADVTGVRKVSMRLANPRAVAQGVHANTYDDDAVDRSMFQLISFTNTQEQVVIGNSQSGDIINLSAEFDGYSLSGEWKLDSIRVSDRAGNVKLLGSDQLAIKGFGASITVHSLQAGQCKGFCSNAIGVNSKVSCELYTTISEAWWTCGSQNSLDTSGACCSPCSAADGLEPLEVRGSCEGSLLVPSPLCGCYKGNASTSWNCSLVGEMPNTFKAGSLCPGGASAQCAAVGSSQTCGPHGSHAMRVQSTPAGDQGIPSANNGQIGKSQESSMPQTTTKASDQHFLNSSDALPKNASGDQGNTSQSSNSAQFELGFGFLAGVMAAICTICIVVLWRRWRSRRAVGVVTEEHPHTQSSASTTLPNQFWRRGSNAVVPILTRQGASTELQSQLVESPRRRGPRARRNSEEDLAALRSMGFPLPLSVQALAATRMQGAQVAAEWILESGLYEDDTSRTDAHTQAWPDLLSESEMVTNSWTPGDAHRVARRTSHHSSRGHHAQGIRVIEFGGVDDVGWALGSRAHDLAHVGIRDNNTSGVERSRLLDSRLLAPLTAEEARQYRRSMRMAQARLNSSKRKSLPSDCLKGYGSSKDLRDDALGGECCVCMDLCVEARLLPCGHADLCMKCAAAIFNAGQPCPLCRTAVQAFTRIQSLNPHKAT